ncbi:hypothetical protein RclHR1_20510002 [Rhizophagus clarus]|uniref:Uncharacterized protein n=1 Tax=Rhizophagus clarus TaxID=94130 RepID=A0A2Z6QQS4_9GLOM|nr:hypothetical protein RclHR1_20510002 [Rhizophagus clarus]
MDEDFVTDTAVDVGVDGLSSPPKKNNTVSTSLSSPPNSAATSSAPNNDASNSLNMSMHARTTTSAFPLNTSPNKATADETPVDQLPIPTPTFSFNRNDYQAAATPNSAPETLKNFSTNKALINAVNNTFLEMKNAKVQQAQIVYDSAQSIARFDSQWAVYCFSTCLRVTPCHYTLLSSENLVLRLLTFPYLSIPINPNDGSTSLSLSRNLWMPLWNNSSAIKVTLYNRISLTTPTNSAIAVQSSSARSKINILNIQRNRSKSNKKRNRSVSFSSALRTLPFSTAHNKPPSLSQQEASEILSLLKALQQDMADVCDRITALELNDQHMTRIERHIGL